MCVQASFSQEYRCRRRGLIRWTCFRIENLDTCRRPWLYRGIIHRKDPPKLKNLADRP